jgi:probable rRNA maturation factor
MKRSRLRESGKKFSWLLPYLRRLAAGTDFKNLRKVNIIMINDAAARRLNRQFLKRRRTTDVLAFRYRLGASVPAAIRHSFPDGDVFINYVRARSQAADFGNSFRRELLTLIIHGLLHLRGYTDLTRRARRRMFIKQEKILNWLHCYS